LLWAGDLAEEIRSSISREKKTGSEDRSVAMYAHSFESEMTVDSTKIGLPKKKSVRATRFMMPVERATGANTYLTPSRCSKLAMPQLGATPLLPPTATGHAFRQQQQPLLAHRRHAMKLRSDHAGMSMSCVGSGANNGHQRPLRHSSGMPSRRGVVKLPYRYMRGQEGAGPLD